MEIENKEMIRLFAVSLAKKLKVTNGTISLNIKDGNYMRTKVDHVPEID